MKKKKSIRNKFHNQYSLDYNPIVFTDKNLCLLPIFSASKGLNLKDKKEKEQYIYLNNGKTLLKVIYGERIPSIYDRIVFGTIEKLYCQQYKERKFLLDKVKDSIKEKTEQYCYKENKTKEELNELEKQEITYRCMRVIRDQHDLHIHTNKIDRLVNRVRAPSKIKQSIATLSQTYILTESSYQIGKDFNSLQISRLPLLEYSLLRIKNTDHYHISLNPLHLYNILTKTYVALDLKLLLSFKSPIAARLCELLGPRLYGLKRFDKYCTKLLYHDLCLYLHIKEHKSKSLIYRQMSEALDELVFYKVILLWHFIEGLEGIEILIHRMPDEEETKIHHPLDS